MFRAYLDRDVERTHDASLVYENDQTKKGVNLSVQWRSWDDDGLMLSVSLFVFGTFLGHTQRDVRCCSNGITLFSAELYPEPHVGVWFEPREVVYDDDLRERRPAYSHESDGWRPEGYGFDQNTPFADVLAEFNVDPW